jgi:aminopeptidase N
VRRPSPRSLAAVVAAAATLLGTPAVAAPSPGASGAGDSYYPDSGNGGYHVGHYDLRLRYQPATDQLAGTATLLATTTQELSQFNLDFALDVSSVRVNGVPAHHGKDGAHELVVTPAKPLAEGAPMTVVVEYKGIPSEAKVDGWSAWRRTADGALAVGEPEMSAWWFPSNDHPTDKATFDVSVAVPEGTSVISNGVMPKPPSPEKLGWSRWSWRSSKPMATYLAFLAIGSYEIRTDTAANGTPVVTAYSTRLGESRGAAEASLERTSEILEWASGVFGPYPFEAMGGVAAPPDGIGFALENQTRPVYGAKFFSRGSNPYVVVHENAHQWFGDSISVRDWRDIWLNEGFAAYAEWMWSEKVGEGTAQELFDYTYQHYRDNADFWQVKPGDPGVDNQFDAAVYDRGAMALHQLRIAMGEHDFDVLLKKWVGKHTYGNASVSEFLTLAHQIAGKDVGPLLASWLYLPSRPEVAAPAGHPALGPQTSTILQEPRSWQKIRATHGR